MTDESNPVSVLPDRAHNNPPGGILPILPPTEADEAARAASLAKAREGMEPSEVPAYDLDAWAALAASTRQFLEASLAWNQIDRLESAAQSERLTDFVTGARSLHKKVDEARKAAKAPWDAGGAKVQAAFAPLLDRLDAIGKTMKAKQADWLAREKARIEAEKRKAAEEAAAAKAEAERLARQAAERGDIAGQMDAADALKAAEKAEKSAARPAKIQAGTATGAGRTMALRTQRTAEIRNVRAALMHFQNDPGVLEALQRAANAAIRAGISDEDARLAGFEIIEKQSAA